MALDPNWERKQDFQRLFTRETVTRTRKTFGGKDDPIHDGDPIAEPNHDGVIVTVNRYATPRPSKKTSSRKGPSASAARKALRASIPVTFA